MAQRAVQRAQDHEVHLRMSYDEYLAWVEENLHSEWADGEVTVFMPPSDRHQDLAGWLAALIRYFADLYDLGAVRTPPFEMRLWPGGPAREPDVLFIAKAHLHRRTPARLDGPADLAIEIISPDSATRDRVDKYREYQRAGILEYWVFDPRPDKERAYFYHLTPEGVYRPVPPDTDGYYQSVVLPGFRLRLDWLWQDPLPPLPGLVQLFERPRGEA